MNKKCQLDCILETATLLIYGSDINHVKNRHIDEFNKAGIDGTSFLDKYIDSYYNFLNSFIIHRIINPGDINFSIDSYDFYNLAALPLLLEKNLIWNIDNIAKTSLQNLIVKSYNEIFTTKYSLSDNATIDEILLIVSKMEVTKEMKWELIELLQNPIPFYKTFCSMIIANLPVFEKLCKDYQEFINLGISNFNENMEQITLKGNFIQTIPMISNPFSMFIVNDTCYCGVYWNKITNHNTTDEMNCEELADIFKAIADKSRLEILSLLKEKSVYNLEISQNLSLSPATVSHHMNTLIVRDIVALEKKGGCTYYHLNREVIANLIRQLENKLL